MSHYFSEKQDSKLDLKKIKIVLKKVSFELYSGSGVFSKDRLDLGTNILIEKAIIPEKGKILDLGCGIGVVGISLKLINPDLIVLMADVNKRAVYLSKKNILLHKLEGIEARKSDSFENILEKFDTVLLNPPQTAGKDVCFGLIEGAHAHLNKDGTLQLVARHNKGGKQLSQKMQETFGNVIEIAKGSGYRIYLSKLEK